MQRTFNSIKVAAMVTENGQIIAKETVIPYNSPDFYVDDNGEYQITEKAAARILKIVCKQLSVKSAIITALTKIEELRYMADEDFYRLSVPMDEAKAAKAEG